MSLGNTAFYAMWLGGYMVDESNRDYVKLALAKCVSSKKIMFKYIFRNAFVPMNYYIPNSFLNTIVNSIYIESLYSVSGMGGLLVDVVKLQDNTMVHTIVIIFVTVGTLAFIFIELYNVLDNIPSIIVLILFSYVMKPSVASLIIAMSITRWIRMASFICN